MAEKRIIVLGANGLLGTLLTERLKLNASLKVLTHSQSSNADLVSDLSSEKEVEHLLKQSKPDICVNTMALTDVNLCETDKEMARKLNVLPVQNIVTCVLSHKLNLKLIQISTDHVYDKLNAKENEVKILNNYALSKYVADEVSQIIPTCVLRTNFFGKSASKKQSFSDWILDSLVTNKKLQGFKDVFFSPLHTSTLCAEIERCLLSFNPGVYNLGSRSGLSKYQFMIELAKHKGFSTEQISPIDYAQANIALLRPKEMRMDVLKYEKLYQVQLPTLMEEIQKC